MAISRKLAYERLSSLVSYLSTATPSKIHTKKLLASIVVSLDPTAEQALVALDLSAANTREEVMDAFAKANPDFTKEELEAFADNWEKNKNVVKDKAAKVASEPMNPKELKEIVALSAQEVKAGMKGSSPKSIQTRLAACLSRMGSIRTASDSSEVEALEKDLISIQQTLGHIKSWRKKNMSAMIGHDVLTDYARDLGPLLTTITTSVEGALAIVKDMGDALHDAGVEASAPVVAARGPVELEIPAVWDGPDGEPVEVLISGMVSPVSPATRESPAEGGVESISMVEKASKKPISMSRDDKDWAADMLMDAAKKKRLVLA